MKVLQHLFTVLALLSAIVVGVSNYMKGESYTWQFIALVWIVNSYTAFFYINFLEKKESK